MELLHSSNIVFLFPSVLVCCGSDVALVFGKNLSRVFCVAK